MKHYNIFLFITTALFAFTACDKNDSLDEDVIVGKMAPQLYWEVASSTATAGNEIDFSALYYTTSKEEIDHLEMWYNVMQTESKSVICPWVKSFSYNVTINTEEEKRIAQHIKSYEHNTENWVDSLRAYALEAKIPTSNTLSSIAWVTPSSYDDKKMNDYFGADFKENFKDSLYNLMKFEDFKNMLTGMSLVENFLVYTDSTFNENSNAWEYHFPKDAENNYPVPAEVKNLYDGITFDQLIFNSSKGYYDVQFTRAYFINANLHCIDKAGVVGLGIEIKIDLN